MFNIKRLGIITALLSLTQSLSASPLPVSAKDQTVSSQDHAIKKSILVTRANFVRAETDRMFGDLLMLTQGVNRVHHIRKPTPLDQQTVVRMNRDTLYSIAIIDTSKGGTITIPPSPDGRYISVHLFDNDHYDLGVIYQPGTYPLPVGVGHIALVARIQVYNSNDNAEIALVNAWQDKLVINAKGDKPFTPNHWDQASLDKLRAELETGSRNFQNFEKAMMPRGKADESQRLYATGAGWGLLPGAAATYFFYSGGHSFNECRTATYHVPKNKAFWSITVYNAKGFIEYENSILNSSNVKLNKDGNFTVYFGSKEICGDVDNRLDTPKGWNFAMRVYRPDASVLNGGYKLPSTIVVKKTLPARNNKSE